MTSKLLLLTLSALVACACALPQNRILGGETAEAGDFPYLVSVRIDNYHACGGVITSGKTILTAAHCIMENNKAVDPSRISVRVGSTNIYAGGKLFKVEKTKIAPKYGNFLNDLAALTLELYMTLDGFTARPVTLPTEEKLPAGATVTIAGWGRTHITSANSYKLLTTQAKTISATECENDIGFGYDEILCLKADAGKGMCNGDAGGPAVVDDVLYGIASFAVGTCGTGLPDGFTNVVHHLKWIKDNSK